MPETLDSQSSPAVVTHSQDYAHRRHTVAPPKTWLGRAGLKAQDALEAHVARVSIHGDPPIYRTSAFPWVPELEEDWFRIRAELDRVMKFRDKMPSFQEILKEVGPIQTDQNWKTFFLAGIGMDCRGNAKRCPETIRLLKKIPGMKTAFFSILSPGKHIPAHRGAYNGVLRLHLGLMVPEPRERCRIRIGNETRHWTEGRALIFDDTFNHEVWNDTDGWRVVLFVDFARPLRPPWHWLNERLLNMGSLAPFLREAGMKQKTWEQKTYGTATRPGK